MIYKILGKDLCDAIVNGAQFIIFSFDGKYALIRSDTVIENVLDVYSEIDLLTLYNDPLYKQPCENC